MIVSYLLSKAGIKQHWYFKYFSCVFQYIYLSFLRKCAQGNFQHLNNILQPKFFHPFDIYLHCNFLNYLYFLTGLILIIYKYIGDKGEQFKRNDCDGNQLGFFKRLLLSTVSVCLILLGLICRRLKCIYQLVIFCFWTRL